MKLDRLRFRHSWLLWGSLTLVLGGCPSNSGTLLPDTGTPTNPTDAGPTDTGTPTNPTDAGPTDTGTRTDPADAGPTDTGTNPASSATAEQLEIFWAMHGGQDAFPASYVNAVEALLHAEDEVVRGDYLAARARIDAVFSTYPLSDPVWWSGVGQDGTNVGTPVAYYGLRMLDEIATAGLEPPPAETYTITMTVVLAMCAEGQQPTNVDLSAGQPVQLNLNPALLDNDHFIIRQSLQLFQHYVRAITGRQLELALRFQPIETCATVGFSAPSFSGLQDYGALIQQVPEDIAQTTDMWWLLYPSNVPSAPLFDNSEFITGGMGGWGPGSPAFIIDDLWLVRKPPHLGRGPYTEVERRVYLPQWLQHEFFHHLYRTWPEFGLEESGHQWFDRNTWPADFVGAWEPDYYAESLEKRLKGATPNLTRALRTARPPIDLSPLSPEAFVGQYTRRPVDNPWHEVQITWDGEQLRWRNAANAQWSLQWAGGVLSAGPDCPYGPQDLSIELVEDMNGNPTTTIAGLWFLGELYAR